MGLFDRIVAAAARRGEAELEKSPVLPAGAQVSQFTPEQLAGIATQMYGGGAAVPLPKQPNLASIPFGPSSPLSPAAINPLQERGRPDPRRWEYPVAWNIFVSEQRLVPWKVLRTAADQIDIIRRCIEVSKNKMAGLDWDITLSEDASEQIIAESGGDHLRAMQAAREKFTPEISRMRKFWESPDRVNGLNFAEWLTMALEEVYVLDALAIYPHADMKGDLHSLEILDGSTIKPLLDDRGMRPQNPYPAYQQILYGFPRGEFVATSDDESLDGAFSADELIYLIRNRRTWTPYGYSPTERSLPLADIYLRRQQWLRAEFTDGVIPDLMFTSDETFGGTPDVLRAWENILNDDLAGQTEQRKRARIIPAGLAPVDFSASSEKFKSDLDEYLIKGITGHFGVLPSEIGFTPNSGLGGAGHQEGEAQSASAIGGKPLERWVADWITDISYKFLGMPRELKFTFSDGRSSDSDSAASRRDLEVRGGQRALNEARADLGLPLIDSPLADMPFLMTASGPMFIGPDGVISPFDAAAVSEDGTVEAQEGISEPSEDEPNPNAPEVEEEAEETVSRDRELKAFLKFAAKSPNRAFKFTTVDEPTADALNEAAMRGDLETTKALARVVLGKAENLDEKGHS